MAQQSEKLLGQVRHAIQLKYSDYTAEKTCLYWAQPKYVLIGHTIWYNKGEMGQG